MVGWMIVNLQSDLLHDPDPRVRAEAVRRLIERGPACFDRVIPLLDSSDPDLREQARTILAALDYDPIRRRLVADAWADYAASGSAEARRILLEAARWCSDARPRVLQKIQEGLFWIESREFFTSRRRHPLALTAAEFEALPDVLLALANDRSLEWQRECLSWRWDPRAEIRANPYVADRVFAWALHAYGVGRTDDATAGLKLFESFFENELYRARARTLTDLLSAAHTSFDDLAPRGTWSALRYTVNYYARDAASPIAKLLAAGTLALPFLVESLSDPRPTPVVVLDDESRLTILGVAELSLHLIERITGLNFENAEAAREWWRRSRGRSPEEWWVEWIVPAGPRDRVEPAKRLVQARGKDAADAVWAALAHARREERLPIAALLAELKDARVVDYLLQLGREETTVTLMPPIYRALRLADPAAAHAYLAERLTSMDIEAFGVADEILASLLVELASSEDPEHGRLLVDLASSPFVPAHFRVPLVRSLGHLRAARQEATDLLAALLLERKFLWIDVLYRDEFAWETDLLLCDVAADALSRLRPDAPKFDLDALRDARDRQIGRMQSWLRKEWKDRPVPDQVNR